MASTRVTEARPGLLTDWFLTVRERGNSATEIDRRRGTRRVGPKAIGSSNTRLRLWREHLGRPLEPGERDADLIDFVLGFNAFRFTADVFNAVGDAHRRAILEVIGGHELGVSELVEALALPQPQVSKHLRVLRDVGLVHCDRVGRRRVYRVHGAALRPIHEWAARFERLWNDRYDRLDDLLVEMQPTSKERA